jgi:hypothetical protein
MSFFDRFKKRQPAEPEALQPALAPSPGEALVVFGGLNMH